MGAAADLLPHEKTGAPVTTRKIADRAGISVGSIYDYFSGKENIYKALILSEIDKNMLVFENRLKAADETDQSIETFASEFIEFISNHFYTKKYFMLNLLISLPRKFTTPLFIETRKAVADRLLQALSKQFHLSPEFQQEQIEKYVFLAVTSFLENFHTFIQMEKMELMDFETFVRFQKIQVIGLLKSIYK